MRSTAGGLVPVFMTGLYCGAKGVRGLANGVRLVPVFMTGLYCGNPTTDARNRAWRTSSRSS